MLSFSNVISLTVSISTVYAAPQPIQQPWSDKTYGPDGPWNAVTVKIAGKGVDLKAGGYFQSWILSDQYCQNQTLFGMNPCDASSAGLVSKPSPVPSIPVFRPNPWWVAGQPGNGSQPPLYPFNIQIPVTNPPTAINVSTALVDSAWLTLPDGTVYPHTLGSLSLGGPAYNQSFPTSGGASYNYSLMPSKFYRDQVTPSASFGLHIGSASFGLPGSMYYGGYDRSRVLGDVLVTPSQTTGTSTPYTGVELLDIGIDTAIGGSPFGFASVSGLLSQGNSSIKGRLLVEMSSNSPYIYLPQSTCDAIASNLPVTWQAKYGLYFWNTQDPNYKRIVTSTSFLSFKFRATNLQSGSLTIKVPWSLLNLTLTRPIISPSVQYFPCRPSTPTAAGTYLMGQAFLQAAFFAIDWNPDAPPGNWFLAQAPGPEADSLPDVQPIKNAATTIQASTKKWEDTWTGHWTVLPANADSTSGGTTSGATSTGTANSGELSGSSKAGIGIGAGALVLIALVTAFILWRRHRRAGATPPTMAEMPYLDANKKHYDTLDAPASSVIPPQPVQYHELGDGTPRPRELAS